MISIIIIIVCVLIWFMFKPKANFASIPEIIHDHNYAKDHCEYENRQYPVGNIPGSNLILTDAETEELNRSFD